MYEEIKTRLTRVLPAFEKTVEIKDYGSNVVKGIDTWAVSILRYSAAFIDWTKGELKELDRDQETSDKLLLLLLLLLLSTQEIL